MRGPHASDAPARAARRPAAWRAAWAWAAVLAFALSLLAPLLHGGHRLAADAAAPQLAASSGSGGLARVDCPVCKGLARVRAVPVAEGSVPTADTAVAVLLAPACTAPAAPALAGPGARAPPVRL